MSQPSSALAAEGAALCRRAEKSARGGFLTMLMGGPDYEEACQSYINAANKYKLGKLWQSGAECFIKAAYLQEKMGDANQHARCLIDAADLIKKYCLQDAIEYYSKAVELYNQQGRFSQSGRVLKGVAEMFEEDCNFADAGNYYKRAADMFDMDEHSKSAYTQCVLKYADFISEYQNKYEEAINIYESEGKKALRNNLTQFGAKEHLFKAIILHLANCSLGDLTDAKCSVDKYEELDPRLSTSREGKLMRDILETFEAGSVEKFTQAIHDYDSVTRLDRWKVHFLSKVKETIAGASPGAVPSDAAPGIDLS